MTQEVQPLTWQKRTNIEEHQQFFAKINEIVGQLSGTVERSETALEEANTALTNARTAVTAANTASAQAIEAATTVAGYNTRLTAVEVQAATNKSDISQLDVETQDLYDKDAQSVKLSADHIQVITGGLDLRGTNKSPNTTVGEDDTVIANGHRIVQELAAYGSTVDAKLNAYAAMVRTTGAQDIYGNKTFHSPVYIDRADGVPYIRQTYRTVDATDIPSYTQTWFIRELWDVNERRMLTDYIGKRANGSALRNLTIRSFNIVDGTVVEKEAALVLNVYIDGYADLRLQDSNGNDKLIATTRS